MGRSLEDSFKRLRVWNIAVGVFQLACGAVIAGIMDYDIRVPWYTFFIQEYDSDEPGFFVPNPDSVGNIPITIYAAIFLWLSGIDHLVVALPGVNPIYNRLLCKNMNPFRWIEYGVSAAFMRILIAQLAGVTSIHLLYAIFGLTMATMPFGWFMEVLNGERLPCYGSHSIPGEVQDSIPVPKPVDWSPFLLGFIPHLFAWSTVACFFFQAVSNGSPPGFVWAIIFILFFLDLLFAVNQFLQFKQVKRYRGFARGEMGYIILSLASKQLLAWINFAGSQTALKRDS